MKRLTIFLLAALMPFVAFAAEELEMAVNPDLELVVDALNYLVLIPFIGPYVPYIVAFIAVAAAVATLPFVPKGQPGTLWYRIRKVLIDWPGMNFGAAKNAK